MAQAATLKPITLAVQLTGESLQSSLTVTLADQDLEIERHGAIRNGETVFVNEKISGSFGVYRATIGGNSFIIKHRRTGFKYRTLDQIRKEAELYRTDLKDLQGSVVPSFYGQFDGKVGDVEECFIVLEDCGNDTISIHENANNWKNMEESIKKPLLEVMGKIHSAGLSFEIFVMPTFMKKGSSLMAVGFSKAKTHDCHWCGDILYGEVYPKTQVFGCSNLYEVCKIFEIWRTFKFQRKLLGCNRRVSKTCPPQDVVDRLFPSEYTEFMTQHEREIWELVYDYGRVFLNWLEKKPSDMSSEEFRNRNPIPPWRIPKPVPTSSQDTDGDGN